MLRHSATANSTEDANKQKSTLISVVGVQICSLMWILLIPEKPGDRNFS